MKRRTQSEQISSAIHSEADIERTLRHFGFVPGGDIVAGYFLPGGYAALMEMQRELLDTLEKIQRDRLARTMEETKVASELVAKMTSARSIPEIMTIYQEWIA